MGEVVLARQRMAGGVARLVVLKTMLPHIASSRKNVELFLREARLAASLSHPNIVQIHDVTEHEGRPCIVMEYLRGGDLSSVQRRASKSGIWLLPEESIAIVACAADGLQHAHAHVDEDDRPRSIVHRDVSPPNLLLSRDGAVKLLDFGIARAMDDPRTQTNVLRGKLAYMSPEQLDAEQAVPVGPPSDQFALGVILWECLAGQRLFYRSSPIETMRAVVGLPIPRPSELVGSPELLDPIVMRALERDVDARWPSCGALASALREAGRALGAGSDADRVRGLVERVLPEGAPRAATPAHDVTGAHHVTGAHARTEPTPELSSSDLVDASGTELEPDLELDPDDPEGSEPDVQMPTYVPPTALRAPSLSPPPVAIADRRRLAPPPSIGARLAIGAVAVAALAAIAVVGFVTRSRSEDGPHAITATPLVALPIDEAPIEVRFVGLPPDATLEIDGATISGTVYRGARSPTPRRVRILLAGAEAWTEDLVLEDDQTIRLALSASTPASTPASNMAAEPTTELAARPERTAPAITPEREDRPTSRRRPPARERIVREYPSE
jgi:serine/threonine protein kinase